MLVAKVSTKEQVKLTGMAKEAMEAGMEVHPFTLRADALPDYVADLPALFDVIYNKAGVDGLFTDFPDQGVQFLKKQGQHQ